MTDLTYTHDGMFTRFIPMTSAGEDVWRTMAEQLGGNAVVLRTHAENVIGQIRRAGYKVSKAKPCTMSIDEILSELED